MKCPEIQAILNPWLDGECTAAESAEVEAHLSACEACAGAANQIRAQDEDLRRAFVPRRMAADALIERVTQQLATVPGHTSKSKTQHFFQWLPLLLAAAAGFLVAVWIFGPERSVIPKQVPLPVTAVARVVATTGKVEFLAPQSDQWKPLIPSITCPSDSVVRTSDNVRCELETTDGCVIRLNDQTEIALVGSSAVELRRGQIWCRAPDEVALEVRVNATNKAPSQDANADQLPTFNCVGPSCIMTGIAKENTVEVLSATGNVNVRTLHDTRSLQAGEMAEIADDRVVPPTRHVDPFLDASWIHPLLVEKGHDNEELAERVDEMLARIGETKVSTMYEREIRALGEYAVLPLVRYVGSERSRKQPSKRVSAMRLAADLAPSWLIPEFITLLRDDDPTVRYLAATTLQRLTGETQGLSTDAWRDRDPQTPRALEGWQQWWEENREAYPIPTLRITSE